MSQIDTPRITPEDPTAAARAPAATDPLLGEAGLVDPLLEGADESVQMMRFENSAKMASDLRTGQGPRVHDPVLSVDEVIAAEADLD